MRDRHAITYAIRSASYAHNSENQLANIPEPEVELFNFLSHCGSQFLIRCQTHNQERLASFSGSQKIRLMTHSEATAETERMNTKQQAASTC